MEIHKANLEAQTTTTTITTATTARPVRPLVPPMVAAPPDPPQYLPAGLSAPNVAFKSVYPLSRLFLQPVPTNYNTTTTTSATTTATTTVNTSSTTTTTPTTIFTTTNNNHGSMSVPQPGQCHLHHLQQLQQQIPQPRILHHQFPLLPVHAMPAPVMVPQLLTSPLRHQILVTGEPADRQQTQQQQQHLATSGLQAAPVMAAAVAPKAWTALEANGCDFFRPFAAMPLAFLVGGGHPHHHQASPAAAVAPPLMSARTMISGPGLSLDLNLNLNTPLQSFSGLSDHQAQLHPVAIAGPSLLPASSSSVSVDSVKRLPDLQPGKGLGTTLAHQAAIAAIAAADAAAASSLNNGVFNHNSINAKGYSPDLSFNATNTNTNTTNSNSAATSTTSIPLAPPSYHVTSKLKAAAGYLNLTNRGAEKFAPY